MGVAEVVEVHLVDDRGDVLVGVGVADADELERDLVGGALAVGRDAALDGAFENRQRS